MHPLDVDPVSAARRLLGASLWCRGVEAKIVEVEAYGGPADGPWPDPAAHSFRGRGGRNTVMFDRAGLLYTYRSHGIHTCANVVCGPDGDAAAVLLRAAVVVDGVQIAQQRRGMAVNTAALARGPGNLCSALGIVMTDNGTDLFSDESPVRLELATVAGSTAGPRVGVSKAADRAWRFWLTGHPEVSAFRRSPRAPAMGLSD